MDAVEGQLQADAKDDPAAALAKTLQSMGMFPAPAVADIKPSPRPATRNNAADAKTRAEALRPGVCPAAAEAAAGKVAELEATLQNATANAYSVNVQQALAKDLEEANAEQTKLTKDAQTKRSKDALSAQLQNRAEGAEKASAAAKERHQGHGYAPDAQIIRLQEIRAHKASDFAASQQTFSTCLQDDRKTLHEMKDSIGLLCSSETSDVVTEKEVAAKADLDRVFPVSAEALPTLPNEPHEELVKQLAALWHFYACVGLESVPNVTFDGIGCKTAMPHTALGDAVWNGYWQDKGKVVQQTDFVPTTMHNALKRIVLLQQQMLSAEAGPKEEAMVRYDAARRKSAQLMLSCSPYA
jgi:hypothetical protein